MFRLKQAPAPPPTPDAADIHPVLTDQDIMQPLDQLTSHLTTGSVRTAHLIAVRVFERLRHTLGDEIFTNCALKFVSKLYNPDQDTVVNQTIVQWASDFHEEGGGEEEEDGDAADNMEVTVPGNQQTPAGNGGL